MSGERYEFKVNDNKSEFWFESEGPKGKIKKAVRFSTREGSNLYNLSFGNLRKNGTINDKTISNNKDWDMILATVKVIIYQFTNFFPNRLVLIKGNTEAKTRLYRIILSSNSEYLMKDFDLFGMQNTKQGLKLVPYEKNVSYYGFVIMRKH